MISKLFKRIALVTLFVVSTTTVAFARDTNWTNGRSYSWSPYIKDIYVSSGSTHYLYTSSTFYFDQAGADANNNIYYFTMEHNYEKDGLEGDDQITNIYDPHFDWDDDNGDGYEEESEVSIEADGWKDMLGVNVDYYFDTWWSNTSSSYHWGGGNIYYVAQRSILNPIGGEYEAYHYDLLTTKTAPTLPPY